MTDANRRASVGQWARLRTDAGSMLRRGAWYRVLSVTHDEVSLSVNARPVVTPRASVELRGERPRRWTVIRQPTYLIRVPETFLDGYLVCPRCRNRVPLPDRSALSVRCPCCNVLSEVAWDENYLSLV
jgi:hypothetical protein